MLTLQFAEMAPLFNPMAAFCMVYANNHHYASRSDLLGIITCQFAGEKGQSRQFFAQLDSVQECSGPQL
jgi:hypothetical protein